MEKLSVEVSGLRVDVIDTQTDIIDPVEAAAESGDKWLMTFVNPASAVYARSHPDFLDMLWRFDLVGSDGIAIVKIVKRLLNVDLPRVSFDSTSLAPFVFSLATAKKLSVVLVGGKPGVATTARDQILKQYPRIDIPAVFDGYADRQETLSAIAVVNPRVVICGMGGLQQELLLLQLVDHGWRGLGFTCGGYLDQLSDGMDYYPAFVDKYNVRALYRLYREPRRLWRRYLVDYPRFLTGIRGARVVNRDERLR